MGWLWCVREGSESWPLHFSFGNEEIYKTVGNKVEKENQELWGDMLHFRCLVDIQDSN